MSTWAVEISLAQDQAGALCGLPTTMPPSSANRGGEGWMDEMLVGDEAGWLLRKHSHGTCQDMVTTGL